MRILRHSLAISLVLLSACTELSETYVYVHAPMDFLPAATHVRVQSFGEGEAQEVRVAERPNLETVANIFLSPRDNDAERTWEILVQLVDGPSAGAEVLAVLRVAGGYVAGEKRGIHAHFETTSECLAIGDCGAGRTCRDSRCVGACFESQLDSTHEGDRDDPTCGECEVCGQATCTPAQDGTDCGCGDVCGGGECQVSVPMLYLETSETTGCTSDGTETWCWGQGRTRAHGQPDTEDTDVPAHVGGLCGEDYCAHGIQSLALGAEFSCGAWTRSGQAKGHSCWGWGQQGAFGAMVSGLDENNIRHGFFQFPGSSDAEIADLQAGRFYTCRLLEDGRIQCAGGNDSNQLARPQDAPDEAFEWLDIPGTWTGLVTGVRNVCGLQDGQLHCWGRSTLASTENDPTPTCIPKDASGTCASFFVSASIGDGFGCGLDAEGRAYCWGYNTNGLLGVEGVAVIPFAQPVDTELRFEKLEVSQFGGIFGIELAVAGESAGGALYAWGNGERGTLGLGDSRDRSRPALVDGASQWSEVRPGEYYTCGLRADQSVHCWGSNGGIGGTFGTTPRGRLGLGLGTGEEDGVEVLRPRRLCFPEAPPPPRMR